MDVDLVVGPVVLRSNGQVLVVLALAEHSLDMMLAAVCQHYLLGGPLITIRDENPLAKDFVLQVRAYVRAFSSTQ